MSASSRTLTRSLAVFLIIVALVTAWFATRKGEQPGREQAAGTQKPGQAVAERPATDDQPKADAPPALPGKTHTRPSPAELEQKRYERMKAEMTAKLEELQSAGLANGHPNVRALQQQLEALEADHARE
jgi:hypothetical protein